MKAWSWKPPGEPSFRRAEHRRHSAPLRALRARQARAIRENDENRDHHAGKRAVPTGASDRNEVTARRWEEVLRKLGHDPVVLEQYGNEEADLLIALHARKSSASIEAFKESFPAKPLVVAMTGTDLYQDLPDDETVLRSLEIATHIVVLQPGGLDILNASLRPKTIVIYQSAQPIVRTITKAANCFQACLVAHLRDVKDPLLAVEAASMLPKASRVQVVHAGAAGSSEMEKRAKDAATKNARYRWIGPVRTRKPGFLLRAAIYFC